MTTRRVLSFRFLSFVGAALALGLAGWGCRHDTAVGTPCMTSADCTSGSKPQVCAQTPPPDGAMAGSQGHICTRACAARTDCPVGFECVASMDPALGGMKGCFVCRGDYDCPAGTYCLASAGADGGTAAPVCQAHSVPPGDFGKDCSVMLDKACTTTGFFCHQEVLADPDAYCTKNCQMDIDCPPNMFCGTPGDNNIPPPSGRQKRCVKRVLCSPCRSDAECDQLSPVCVPDSNGRGYCTRSCDPNSSMPCEAVAASRGWLQCSMVAKDPTKPDVMVNVCTPRYGSCYGAGAPCDPCRQHLPQDCQKVSGRSCYFTDREEGLCLQECTSVNDCTNDSMNLTFPIACHSYQTGTGTVKYCTASSSTLTCWP